MLKNVNFRMLRVFIIFLAAHAEAHEEYYESVTTTPLMDRNFRLTKFSFRYITDPNPSSHYLDIFPQAAASVLGPDRDSLTWLQGNIVRGRWKEPGWGKPVIDLYPFGSSMSVISKNNTSTIWTKAGWMFSTLLAGAFESLDQSRGSLPWITPMDLPDDARTAANPNEDLCTEQVQRFVDMTPCGKKHGIGKIISGIEIDLAKSEYVSISLTAEVDAEKRFVLNGHLAAVFGESPRQRLELISPETACHVSSGVVPSARTRPSPIRVNRSIIGTKDRPERSYGTLLLVLTNEDMMGSHTIDLYEQLPFFLIPMWHTHSVRSSLVAARNGRGMQPSQIVHTDGTTKPSFITWSTTILPGEQIVISIQVYKKYIHLSNFRFGFEKGFDIGPAVYRIDHEIVPFFTRSLTIVIPLPDGTSTFNIIAVACTAMALFFGMNFRNFISRRSDLVGTHQEAVEARYPPIVRLAKWIYRRIARK